MAANELVNLSLDEIIARQDKFKKFGGAQRGRSRGARGGGFFRNGFRGRPIPTIGLVQRQKFAGQGGQRVFNEKLCTVHISNLGPMVTTRDLQELFARHPYVDIAVHYDQRGNSRGTAVVLFRRFDEAMQLKREFTGVKLDGRLMELYAMSNSSTSPATRVLQQGRVSKSLNRRKSGGFGSIKSPDNFGGFRVLRGSRSKMVGNRRFQMTAEELDKELDAYMRQAKHTRIAAP
ncbi:unnamed protein product [Enterobius vermicularis]|uniref:RRM domain-containing protein n=1 Tax=Enterobius vermicularis TaxID=51028 RepID=A0A0N4VHZ9_ENTVE|nr:unnamed protein product [Enterobius vermicularis]